MDLRQSNPRRCPRLLAGGCLLALACVAAVPHLCAEVKQGKLHKESKRADTREIEALESQWRDAVLKGDTASMDKILADDFFGISSNGTVSDKQQYIHRMTERRDQFSRFDLMDRKVRIQPITAIVTSQAHVTGELDGHPVDGVFRYTKVYGREGGSWRVLNFEATRVSGPHPDEMEMHRGMPLGPQSGPGH